MQRQSDVCQVCIEKEVTVGSVQLQPGPDQGPSGARQGPGPQIGCIVQVGWRSESQVRVPAVGTWKELQEQIPSPGRYPSAVSWALLAAPTSTHTPELPPHLQAPPILHLQEAFPDCSP